MAAPLHRYHTMIRALLHRERFRERRVWNVAPLWVALALVLGFTTDNMAGPLFRGRLSPMSVSSTTAILSSIASGMIAFTGLVFSIMFLILQFGSSAFSPRLVREIGRHDRIMGHSFGVFTGTFVYSLLAIRSVDLGGRSGTNVVVMWVAFTWLLGSVALFLRLVPRIRTLSLTHMLELIGRYGREAIARSYPPAFPTAHPPPPGELPPVTAVVHHRGPGKNLQELDVDALVAVARDAGGIIMIPHAIGDVVIPGQPLALLLDAPDRIEERRLRQALILGPDRAVYRDPSYALRLLVDIAIRALSPAVNDPTTAVQALDRIEALLLQLSHCQLDSGRVADADGTLRLIYAQPTWEDLLLLGLMEIQQYGQTSIQVQRRLGALLHGLAEAVPEERRPAVRALIARREAGFPAIFQPTGWIPEAEASDPQGLGHTIS